MKIIVSRINQEWGEDQLEWIKVAPVVGRDPIEILNNPGELKREKEKKSGKVKSEESEK